MNSQSQGSTGLWVTLIIVALVAIGAAFYYYYTPVLEPETGGPAVMMEETASDEPAAIEADLNAIDLDSLGAEISDIQKELNQ